MNESEIISALELTEKEKRDSEKEFFRIFGRSAKPNFKIEKEILGGLIFKAGDKILDLSLREKLNRLKLKLSL